MVVSFKLLVLVPFKLIMMHSAATTSTHSWVLIARMSASRDKSGNIISATVESATPVNVTDRSNRDCAKILHRQRPPDVSGMSDKDEFQHA